MFLLVICLLPYLLIDVYTCDVMKVLCVKSDAERKQKSSEVWSMINMGQGGTLRLTAKEYAYLDVVDGVGDVG